MKQVAKLTESICIDSNKIYRRNILAATFHKIHGLAVALDADTTVHGYYVLVYNVLNH